MFRPRIIPVLLLNNNSLVKSVRFKNYNYIGDPMNAVKLFNEFKADELVFLDIKASQQNRLISLDLVRAVGEEANSHGEVVLGLKVFVNIQRSRESYIKFSSNKETRIHQTSLRNFWFINNSSLY